MTSNRTPRRRIFSRPVSFVGMFVFWFVRGFLFCFFFFGGGVRLGGGGGGGGGGGVFFACGLIN